MIKQAQTYLHGARLSVALVGAAVAAFVVLASLGGFSSFAVPGLGGDSSTPTLDDSSLPAQSAALVLNPAGPTGAGGQQGAGNRGPDNGNAPGNVATPPSVDTNPAIGDGTNNGGSTPGPSNPPTTTPGNPGTGTGTGSGSNTPAPAGIPLNPTTVQNTVNNTVNTVNQATGGALSQTGVVEGATGGLIGPGSTAGQAIDNTLGTVGNVLGGGK